MNRWDDIAIITFIACYLHILYFPKYLKFMFTIFYLIKLYFFYYFDNLPTISLAPLSIFLQKYL